MNKERLLKLADFLTTVPEKALVMQRWQATPATKPEGKTPGDCGFAGCAMGWAVHAKLFEGLTFDFRNGVIAPLYENRIGFGAAQELFDIDDREAEFLFEPSCYEELSSDITPQMVVERIRAFVAGEVSPYDCE